RTSCRTDIYSLFLHDALPISYGEGLFGFKELRDAKGNIEGFVAQLEKANGVVHKIRYEWSNNANQFTPINQETVNTVEKHVHRADRKSTRLNSSHVKISYAVF